MSRSSLPNLRFSTEDGEEPDIINEEEEYEDDEDEDEERKDEVISVHLKDIKSLG